MNRDLVAVVDVETTGLDPNTDRVIEVAWALVDLDTAKVVSIQSALVPGDENHAEAVNGIPVSLLRHETAAPLPVRLPRVEAVLAHNAAFDRSWGAFQLPGLIPWACTCDDWEWPLAKGTTKRSLTDIALAHGVGVVTAHRAFSDVMTLCLTLERAHEFEGLRSMLRAALVPRKTYAALVSYADNQKAKDRGFRWQPEPKLWTKRLTEAQAAEPMPFKLREVSE